MAVESHALAGHGAETVQALVVAVVIPESTVAAESALISLFDFIFDDCQNLIEFVLDVDVFRFDVRQSLVQGLV